MKKRLITFLGILILSLVGCSRPSPSLGKRWMEDSKEKRVLCTIAQIGDLVERVGGDRIKVHVLVQKDLDPHSYELVKGDDEKFERADIIFYHGLHLEHGASLSQKLLQAKNGVPIGESIATRHPELILKRGDVTDPHLWMDVSLWEHAVEPIVEALSRLDPEGVSEYRERGELLLKDMDDLHQRIFLCMRAIPLERRYLLTSHDAFRYFARRYLGTEEGDWQNRFAAPEGLAPDGQLSTLDIQKMVDFLSRTRLSVVFPESNVSQDSIRKITISSQKLGLEVRMCHEPLYGDSTGGLSYLDMMDQNAKTIGRNL